MKPQELLERLVATPSVSGDERRIADFVARHARAFGADVRRDANNVWFAIGAGTGPTLMFASHLDTVPPCAGWDTDPLKPRWSGDRLVGLGVNDAKGAVTAMLALAESLIGSPDRIGGRIVFALTAEEETGGAHGIASVLDAIGAVDAAVVGEPTALEACTAQRGMLILNCVAHGISGHVAHGHAAVNAIEIAARDIATLAAWEFPEDALLGRTRAQVTQVSGGLARNQVPDRCEFFVDLRTTPNLDHETVVAELSAALESEVTVHSARYRPRRTGDDVAIVRAALAANGKTTPVGSSTTSDWAFLDGVPAVKLGPGDTLRSHRPNEYLTTGELADGIRVYGALARRYFEEVAR